MPEGLGYLMRPVDRGYCRYESLKDCTLDLYDILLMNDDIDVREENERLARLAMGVK